MQNRIVLASPEAALLWSISVSIYLFLEVFMNVQLPWGLRGTGWKGLTLPTDGGTENCLHVAE